MLKLKYSIFWQIALASLAFLFVFNSCSDKEDDVEPDVKKYRLKTIVASVNEAVGFTYLYNADNRIEKISYSENGIEKQKDVWAWGGDSVKITYLTLEKNIWYKRSDPLILYYANGKLQKSVDTVMQNAIIRTFSWNGDLLVKETVSSIFNFITKDYIYENGKLTGINQSSNNVNEGTTSIEYSNGRPLSVKTYSNNKLSTKTEFTNSGENITSVTIYNINSGVENGVYCIENRAYDASNKLTSITGSCTTVPLNFTYEEGVGNFFDQFIAQGGWLNMYLFPDAYPSGLYD